VLGHSCVEVDMHKKGSTAGHGHPTCPERRYRQHPAVVECIVNPAGSSSILWEGPAVDQTPEVEYATDDVRDPTNIDGGRCVIQLVPAGS